ncbi:glutamate-5-semialdehyde dehydrogenase [candidate division KSB1 bacterium]|nr:glutamate-5-semialdehyde dehydrogenase [candidate division KSB1 bacterium]
MVDGQNEKKYDFLEKLARAAGQATRKVSRLSSLEKNNVLNKMAATLLQNAEMILAGNVIDVQQARQRQLAPALIDRLFLNLERLNGMAKAIQEVATLPDPIGAISNVQIRPNGLQVARMRIPLGVIAIIYEARPNVTSDAAALCLKAGNAVILRGGSEAFQTNIAIVKALHQALESCNLPTGAITFLPTTERDAMVALLKLDQYIDLVIPRGGEGLIRFVAENSRIPVIKHYKGICHLYVDEYANLDIAMNLLIDGKLSRPGVCNALETLLVHDKIAERFLKSAGEMLKNQRVEIRGCQRTLQIVPFAKIATENDFATEYLGLIISVKIVKDIDEAITHIELFGSDHTEVIVTDYLPNAQRFIREVDSSVVAVNASSRFSDGGELGLGAEIGISTTKLHAYGPMGVEALTTQKFVILGEGQTRHDINTVLNQ